MGGGGGVGGLGFGYAENSILHVNHFNDTINGKLCLCENSPRFHQVAGPKSKFPGGGGGGGGGGMSPDMLCTRIHTCPHNNP